MKFYYKSITNEASQWLGHKITVQEMQVLKPKLHLQACGRGFFKLCYGDKTVFWANQCRCHYGVAILKTFDYESILSPIRSSEVEKRKGLNQAEALESWSSYFIKDLEQKANELLYGGEWLMSAYVYTPISKRYTPLYGDDSSIWGVEESLNETNFQQIDWFMGDNDNIVSLKRVNEHDGRLKWWRKKAREDALPPVVLLSISGLNHCIILDGHYRLKASYDEGVKVDILVLKPIEKCVYTWDNEKVKSSILKKLEQDSFDVKQTNYLLLKAYNNQDVSDWKRSRVFGQSTNGMKEVIAYLNELGRLDLMQSFFDGKWDDENGEMDE